jgi:murein L,D-transpeptidase YafK
MVRRSTPRSLGTRFLLWAAGAAIAVVLAVTAWDAMKLDRRVPELVPAPQRVTKILVEKSRRRMTLFRDGDALHMYDVALGSSPVDHKQQEGDGRTPEGNYAVDFKNARSRFHLSLRVSYPGPEDREHARQRGVPPGGDIMIHGLPRGLGWLGALHLVRDWTDGCIAVTNQEIEEIWALVDTGIPIEIKP